MTDFACESEEFNGPKCRTQCDRCKPTSQTFTDQEKLAELEREIAMRRRVYSWQVRNGKLSKQQARRQLDLMIAIKSDYAEKIKTAQTLKTVLVQDVEGELLFMMGR